MKNTKRRLETFAFFDHTGIQAHLEAMAAKGWMVEQPGTYLWRYRRVQPQTLRFAVTYFPTASEFDPGPTEGQQTYQAYCQAAGWRLAARWGQMQIFYTAAQDPVPLETDARTQVDTVHRAMRRSSLPGMTAVAALGLFQACFQLWRFWEDPVDFLSTPSSLYALPTWLLFLGVELYELLFYFRWHRKAKALAEATGEFLPIRTHRRLSLLLVVIALLFFLSAFLGNARITLFAALFWLAAFAVILLLTGSARSALKGMRAPRAVTRAVTVIMSAVLAVAMVAGMTALIFRGVRSGWLEDRKPVETYEYMGMTWEVYQDDIPLRVEALTDTDYTQWSTEARSSETVLAAFREYTQRPRMGAREEPDLEYDIVEVKAPFLYGICKNSMLERYWFNDPVEYRSTYRPIDAAPWGAAEAYQLYRYPDSPSERYLLCWPGRIAEIRFDEAPTVAQMALAGEILKTA